MLVRGGPSCSGWRLEAAAASAASAVAACLLSAVKEPPVCALWCILNFRLALPTPRAPLVAPSLRTSVSSTPLLALPPCWHPWSHPQLEFNPNDGADKGDAPSRRGHERLIRKLLVHRNLPPLIEVVFMHWGLDWAEHAEIPYRMGGDDEIAVLAQVRGYPRGAAVCARVCSKDQRQLCAGSVPSSACQCQNHACHSGQALCSASATCAWLACLWESCLLMFSTFLSLIKPQAFFFFLRPASLHASWHTTHLACPRFAPLILAPPAAVLQPALGVLPLPLMGHRV